MTQLRDLHLYATQRAPILRNSRMSDLLRAVAVGVVGLSVAQCMPDAKLASTGSEPVAVAAKAEQSAPAKVVGFDKTGKPYTVGGQLYVPREEKGYSATGLASWYGPTFHGRQTANGEQFDRNSVSVAHPTMPLPSYVRVTNVLNGRSMIARVNDRGPFHGNRLVDVSEQVAIGLNFKHLGTARLKVDYIGRAPVVADDNATLLATLRTDGIPAQLNGFKAPTIVASVKASPAIAAAVTSETTVSSDQPTSRFSSGDSAMPLPPVRPYAIGEAGFRPHFSSTPSIKLIDEKQVEAKATDEVAEDKADTFSLNGPVPLPPVRPDRMNSVGPETVTTPKAQPLAKQSLQQNGFMPQGQTPQVFNKGA